ncbi:unnamed protein product [Ilex paraguariensis]|uniref:Pseudouridine synthase RsuA/RluA-like domain-containing protein n=1 Tax=Ilex paraguariensis TaxID=185542 RepID=A0ABC8TQ37_9AQUA
MAILNMAVCFHVLHKIAHQEWNTLLFQKEGLFLSILVKRWIFLLYLIHFGAVHYALVCPEPPPSATPEQIRVYKAVTAPSVLHMRRSIKGKTFREAQKTFRITRIDEFVERGMYLRVHVHPKRFPRCYEIDWKSRIIAVTESYVILDKPAATSVGGTTDNIEESCATFATRALGLTTPLMTTHQIDNCTEGCVVLARTKEYSSVFHGKIREKKVKKLYLALAAAPVPTGVITHYMRPVNIAPRLISEEFVKGWQLCQLDVLECRKVPWPNALIEKKYGIVDCGWPSKDFAYECKINLLTGRTHQELEFKLLEKGGVEHSVKLSYLVFLLSFTAWAKFVVLTTFSHAIQVRVQLAAIGAPIVGDSRYMPAAIAEMFSPGLNPLGKHKKQYTNGMIGQQQSKEWIALSMERNIPMV